MTIPQLLEEQAVRLGDKPFVLLENATLSYREVNENACRAAVNLARHGVEPGSKIVLLMGNCPEFLFLFLGAGRIGATVVPVNPTLKPDEIAYISADSDAETLITIPEFAPLLPQLRKLAPHLKRVFMLREPVEGTQPFAGLLAPVDSIPPVAAQPSDDAALIYTSGTTGMPKGVMLSHDNYIWNARMISTRTNMTAAERLMCVLPLFHVNAQVASVLSPMLVGGDLYLQEKFNPFHILPLIEKHRATIMSAVPTVYNLMCRMPKAAEYDLSSIRFFASGAAPLAEDTYLATQEVLKRPLIMGYGLSECTCASAIGDIREPVKWNSVGAPLRHTPVRIVGKEGNDMPIGEVGEIWVSGPSVMKGYYKNPEATKEVIVDGWLRTGDLGRLDEDGYLYIVGRVKDMIIRGGQNVYPQQVENVVMQLPAVEECAIVGVEEARWGQEILAVVKLAEGHTITDREVIDFCRKNLAPYKCPSFVRFVPEFPKTATGKIKKNEVAAQYADIAQK